MNGNFINSAYDSLSPLERAAVDQYVASVKTYADSRNELIIHALNRPIAPDIVTRSRGMLEKPLVIAAIYDKIAALSNEQDLAAKRLLHEHMNIAMANMADYLDICQQTGQPTVNFSKCTRRQMAAVKSIKVTKTLFGTNISLELHSKQSHLEALGKMMGLEERDNTVYLDHIAAPQDAKPLTITATPQDAEKAYSEYLEAYKT